jgi:hypothetical protein
MPIMTYNRSERRMLLHNDGPECAWRFGRSAGVPVSVNGEAILRL